jgi:molybdate transport repressor ModE-like protein
MTDPRDLGGARPRGHPALLQRILDPLRLRLVLEVERHGSITRAAEACSMAQPTASEHLRTLEAAIGQRLYERAGRATRLTYAGQLLARHAARVLSELEGLEQDLAAHTGSRTGTLRLASCDGFGTSVLPDILCRFASEHALIDLRVRVGRSADVLRAVAQGDADLGIAGENRRLPGVVIERLLRDELVGIAPPGPGGMPELIAPPALAELTLVTSSPDSSTRALTERMLGRVGGRPARRVELDSIDALKRAVGGGLGVAFVSRLAVGDELISGALRQFALLGAGSVECWLDVIRAADRTPTPVEQAFERQLRAGCAALGEADR